MNRNTKRSALLRLMSLCAIALIAMGSILGAVVADRALKARAAKDFEKSVSAINKDLSQHIDNYSNLLYMGRAFISNSNEVTQNEWDNYFREQQVFTRYEGISTVTFLRYFDESNKAAFLAKMRAQEYFGGASFAIRPEGVRPHYAVAELVSTENNVRGSFGLDTYTNPVPKQAMDKAAATGRIQATPPFVLGTGVQGFAAYLPVYKDNTMQGFGLISFRTDDLVKSLFKDFDTNLRYKIIDTTDQNKPEPMFSSPTWQEEMPLKRSDTLNFGGRTWEVTFATTNDYSNSFLYPLVPLMILALGILVSVPLLAAFAVATRGPRLD